MELGGWGALIVVVLTLGGLFATGVIRLGRDCAKEQGMLATENERLHAVNETLTTELREERARAREELVEYRRRFWDDQTRRGG
ncbi:MAG: hypothetical protein ACFB50_10870 [Rubrobacteraceae bacterium]